MIERSLLIPEIHGLNPNIGKISSTNSALKLKRQKERKRDREWPIFKKVMMPLPFRFIDFEIDKK